MYFPSSFLIAVSSFVLGLPSICAASVPALTVPACSSQFNYQWSVNSKGQSPCTVAGYLASVCTTNGVFEINSITPSQEYVLTTEEQSNCTCSTVYYSALSACANCQGATQYLTWSDWSTNCSTVYTAYPNPIPSGTAVPQWAFQAYPSKNSTFNATSAQLTGDVPESTAPSSTGSSTSTSASSPSTSNTSNTNPPSNSNDSGKSKAGAIAGGVVGGLAFVCIAVILAFWFLRHRRRRQRDRAGVPALSLADDDVSMTMPTPFLIHPPVSSNPPRVYDPSNPETFPPPIQNSGLSSPPSHYHSLTDTSTRYTGMPEV